MFLPKEKDCTGCAACLNACSKSAITMHPTGSLGHLLPSIDKSKCVECGLCQKVCPEQNPVTLRLAPYPIAAWAKDPEDNKKSTSGGVATCLSRFIISQGGVVYGSASFGPNVKHIRVETEDEIELLRGSKYVQSRIDDIFSYVLKDLKDGRYVLFVGTPCQVAGLLKFLKQDYTNLVTVDLICHGVPSQKVLLKHLSTISTPSNIKKIVFREGQDYVLQVYDQNGKLMYLKNYWQKRYSDDYLFTFENGYTYRESCYSCMYARPQRCSDLTIGDFWGLGKKTPFVSEIKNYGYSVVLPNTDKGVLLLHSMKDLLFMYQRSLEEAVDGNPQLRASFNKSFSIKVFRYLYRHGVSMKKSLLIADNLKIPYWTVKENVRPFYVVLISHLQKIFR